MPAWPRGVPPRARIEAHDREVAGAAAEIADQHGGRLGEGAGEQGAGGFRLQRQGHLRDARVGVGAAQAVGAECVVHELAGEAHRAADDDAGGRRDVGEEGAEEAADQALHREGVAEDAGLREALLRQVGLHRHDQPAVERVLEVGVDRLGAGGVPEHAARGGVLGPEAQDGTEHVAVGVALRGHAAVSVQQGHDAVGGAEIDADRLDHGAPRGRARVQARSRAEGKGAACHCEERSDAAIPIAVQRDGDCFARARNDRTTGKRVPTG